MARIRTIKPSFFTSDDVSALPLRARLTWIGLWTHCDDAGRAKDHVKLIKAAVWPLDDTSLRDIEEDLTTLADHGRIVRYQVDGRRYLEVTNWSEHQSINRPTPSKIPPAPLNKHPPLTQDSVSAHTGKGREGKGREGDARAREAPPTPDPPDEDPPNPKCDKHQQTRNPPRCGDCADARRGYESWHADKRRRLDSAPRCAIHAGQPAENCAGCAGDRKAAS